MKSLEKQQKDGKAVPGEKKEKADFLKHFLC